MYTYTAGISFPPSTWYSVYGYDFQQKICGKKLDLKYMQADETKYSTMQKTANCISC